MTTFAFRRYVRIAVPLLLALGTLSCGRRAMEPAPPIVPPGPMPAGGDWTGVYSSASHGDVHILITDQRADGAWRTPDGALGMLVGAVIGNEIRYAWRERRRNARGYPTPWFGRGYVVYEVNAAGGPHELQGEWGLDWSEAGQTWSAVKRPGQEPNIDAVAMGTGEELDGDEYDSEFIDMCSDCDDEY